MSLNCFISLTVSLWLLAKQTTSVSWGYSVTYMLARVDRPCLEVVRQFATAPYPTATTSKEAGKVIAKVNLGYEIFERAHDMKRTGLGSPDFNFLGDSFILVFISKQIKSYKPPTRMKQSAYWPAAIQENQNRNRCSHTHNRKVINASKRSLTNFLLGSQFPTVPLSVIQATTDPPFIPPENHVIRVMKKIGQPRHGIF